MIHVQKKTSSIGVHYNVHIVFFVHQFYPLNIHIISCYITYLIFIDESMNNRTNEHRINEQYVHL